MIEDREMQTSAKADGAGMRILRISLLMVAIFGFFYLLPDFAPETPETLKGKLSGDTSPELCGVSTIGFTVVNENRSPLVTRLLPQSTPTAGEEVRVTIALGQPGGRPISFEDLDEVHTEKFHLLIIDSTLGDYHHKHPIPTAVPGEYEIAFTPDHGGPYRFFAEVVPTVTGRPAQGVATLEVEGAEGKPPGKLPLETTIGDYEFYLKPPQEGIRADDPGVLTFGLRHVGGEAVPLEPVMGAWAHVVAFDRGRSGFAHMHPVQEGLDVALDPEEPQLDFIFFAPNPGPYMVWAQVNIAGEERFIPFTLEVL